MPTSSQTLYEIELSSKGVSREFLENLSLYKKDFLGKFSIPSEKFDDSLESLDLLDSLITKEINKVDGQIFNGLLAYYGDVLKKRIDGEWHLAEITIKGSICYFPVIKKLDGTEYDFYGDIEDYLLRVGDNFGLSRRMKAMTSKFELKSNKMNAIDFPPPSAPKK